MEITRSKQNGGGRNKNGAGGHYLKAKDLVEIQLSLNELFWIYLLFS